MPPADHDAIILEVQRFQQQFVQCHQFLAGQAGIAVLDAESRLTVRAAARIYHAIGTRIRRRGYEVLDERARVSTIAKFGLFAGAMLMPAGGPAEADR